MRVKLAKTAGFCMGVRRAVEMALEESNRSGGPIVTLGPLIHNNEVLNLLSDKGIRAVDDPAEVGPEETAIIRAHGIPPQKKEILQQRAGRVVDATCPRVVKVQVLIRRYTQMGGQAIIVGDRDHAEVIGLLGQAQEGRGVVISGVEEVEALEDYDKVMLVAQTTQSEALFEEIAERVRQCWPKALIHNTICPATHERQAEVVSLGAQVEAMVVVGGSFSANTQRLAQIAARTGIPAYAVETETGLDKEAISGFKTVGVTAGASTPNWLIRKVVEELRGLRSRGEPRINSILFRVYRFLLKSNTLLALGGAGLALAGGLSLGLNPSPSMVLIPALYLYAIHILNHFLDRQAVAYNDPDGIRFYANHRYYLIGTAVAAALIGLIQSFRLGLASFLTFLLLSVMGLVYPIRLVPARFEHLTSYVKLKDFPGSKPLSIALAWGTVCGLWPVLSFGAGVTLADSLILALIAALAFVRAGFVDVLDIQGDLAVGKETLAILLGERRVYRLLIAISAVTAGIGLGAVTTGILSPAGLTFCLAPALLGAVIIGCRSKRLLPGIFMDGLVEAGLLLASVPAWLVLLFR